MSAWEDLVTTALLGTDRRSLPDTLPPPVARLAAAQTDTGLAVLAAAAGSTAQRHGGARPEPCPDPPHAPRQDLDLAPEPAQTLLAQLLRARDHVLVDEWLAQCAARGLGVRAGLWTALVTSAAGTRGPDRGLVRVALGGRGRGFVATNPRWEAVARAEVTSPRAGPVEPVDAEPGDPSPARLLEWLVARPGPWDDAVSTAALRLLASGHLPPRALRALSLVLAHRTAGSPRGDLLDLGLVEAVDVLDTRLRIRRSFDDPPETRP